MADANSDKKEPRSVAVIAVHGVGYHATGVSADAMANLLSGVNGYGSPPGPCPYGSFVTNPIQVPLPGAGFFPSLLTAPAFQALQPESTAQKKQSFSLPAHTKTVWDFAGSPFQERRDFFADKFTFYNWKHLQGLDARDIADEFMKAQILHYNGDPLENTLRTVRLEGQRAGEKEGAAATGVHIYDMQWSDLTRSSSVLNFFMSFYQLLIHLTALGRIAVDHAALEHHGDWRWLLFQRIHNYAVRVFDLFVVNLLVMLPVVAFSPLPLLLVESGNQNNGVVAMAIAAAVFFVGVMRGMLLLSQRYAPPLGLRGWWPWTFLAAILSAIVSAVVSLLWPFSVSAILTVEWWVCGAVAVVFVLRKYQEVRPGAVLTGSVELALVALGFAVCLIHSGGALPPNLQTASFWMIQYMFLAIRMAWMLFIVLMLLDALLEGACRIGLRKQDAAVKARARAALRTGRFAVALPALLFLLLTFFFWSGIYHFAAHRIQLFSQVKSRPAPFLKYFPALVLSSEATESVLHAVHIDEGQKLAPPYRFLEGLLIQAAPPGLPVVLGFIGAGLTFLILMVLPSIGFEFQTPCSAPNGPARRLGAWLSSGLHSFHWIIWCFWGAAFAVPYLDLLVVWLGIHFHCSWITPASTFLETVYEFKGMIFTAKLVSAGGAFIAGSATLLLGILVKYSSSALDAILDVDNYLRSFPANNTPRARIVERYISLLRYLHAYRCPSTGKPYDRIVIVAHSLGSMISADLLRFLSNGAIPQLRQFAYADQRESFPIFLFTMGSPLRQLMNRFFPHLYLWIREVPDGAGERPDPAVTDNPIPRDAPPNPVDQLGVKSWINYYRSGDYIGRSIWKDNWYVRNDAGNTAGGYPTPSKVFSDRANSRFEACTGLGAHTHYWDRTAPDVGQMLDALIR